MLEIRELHKDYEGQPLLRGITFSVRARETVCLLGPSGSGKSTLLRLIAGLEAPEGGQILWDGHDLVSAPPHLRDFGLVFQDYALFPHLNVFDNVAFGLRMRGRPQSEVASRVSEVLGIVNLEGFELRAVTDLSGGEQQRVALARALAPRPRLLMFDEPLGALDRALREDLLGQLRTILHQTRIPAIYVTHDQEEAFTIADRVLLLHEGSIVRAGTPADVWAQPGSAWAAEFLGLGNVVPARVLTGGSKVGTQYGVFTFKSPHKHRAGDQVHVLLRPADSERRGVVKGIVRDTLFRQDGFRIVLQGGLHFDLPRAARIGSKVTIPVEVDCLGPHAGPTVEGDG
jgi:ABC-type Fe3+/spermidine/putrescine transport system ATPase subunit